MKRHFTFVLAVLTSLWMWAGGLQPVSFDAQLMQGSLDMRLRLNMQRLGEEKYQPDHVFLTMQQSGEGLVRKFGFDHDAHFAYIEKILGRFSNPYLRDECDRVGREPLRKLSPNDRLILPMLTAKGFGLPYDKLLLAIGAALHFDNPQDPQSVEMLASIKEDGLEGTIVKYTGIGASDPLVGEIAAAFKKVETL